ncbi:MAG TPA: YdcH family protein [Xanthomonadales bacterium]
MFEHHQDLLQVLIRENEDFRRNYNRHQELDKRVTAAELGTAPMEDLALNRLKKEKLWLKDKLAVLINAAQT